MAMMPYVTSVLMGTSLFFTSMHLFVSNPFKLNAAEVGSRIVGTFTPKDGQGLNALLQDPMMVIHPPMLYLGFVGMVVPFAFAIAALITRQLGDTWIRTRDGGRWLPGESRNRHSSGRILGLSHTGLGRYWAMGSGRECVFDAMVDRHGVSAFRDGSGKERNAEGLEHRPGDHDLHHGRVRYVPHTQWRREFGSRFCEVSDRRIFLAFIVIALSGSFYLLIDRLPYLKNERQMESVVSRESSFLFNNLVLLVACFSVLFGTMLPSLSDWITGNKITVSRPFFDAVDVPIAIFLLFLTGVGPLLAWEKDIDQQPEAKLHGPRLPLAYLPGRYCCCSVFAIFTPGSRGHGGFVGTCIIREFYKGARARSLSTGENFFEGLVNLTLRKHPPIRRLSRTFGICAALYRFFRAGVYHRCRVRCRNWRHI
jgi:cytochrome c-type biogenesis protein CcmF